MKQTLDGNDIIRAMQERHKSISSKQGLDPREAQAFENDLRSLLDDNPDHPVFAFQLGTYYMQIERTGEAIALIKMAMQNGAMGSAPLLNMAAAYKSSHHDDQAEKCYKDALEEARKEGDTDAMAHSYHGLASLYVNRGTPDVCIMYAKKALELNPTDRHALWNKGLAHLERGDWEEGFKLYHEAGFTSSEHKGSERKIKDYNGAPQWDGKPKPDGSKPLVVCYGEQGVGDEVMFASMLPDLFRDCDVILDVDKRLENLMRDSFPEAKGVYTTSSISDFPFWAKDYPIDAMVPMGSLGYWYRKTSKDFPKVPFFKANEAKREAWRERLKDFKGLKVGICYYGGLKKTRQDKRSIAPPRLENILKIEGIDWFSLQYHQWSADVAAKYGAEFGVPIHHWGDAIDDWDEMAAFISELDLVITINSSLHHLCGALGVKQWCLTPKYCAWRYGVSGPSPWYDNCELFRQKKDDDWETVLRNVATELRALTAKEVAA